MKLITLMMTRNEAHILPFTLKALTQICDHIIIADQYSEDGTQDIVQSFPNTTLIHNTAPPPPKGRFDADGRALLLDAARNFDGKNLLVCLDADEIPPPNLFKNFKAHIFDNFKPGTRFKMRWIQLWQSKHHYRPPVAPRYHGIWQSCTFYDDRTSQYKNAKWIHGRRIPHTIRKSYLHDYILIHLHWVFWHKALWQQVWYQLSEFKNAGFNEKSIARINDFYYDPVFEGAPAPLKPLPAQWQEGYDVPPPPPDDAPNWRKDSVMDMLGKHGLAKFEKLNIWYIPQLKELFKKECRRPPAPLPLKPRLSTLWRAQKIRAMLAYRSANATLASHFKTNK